MLTRFSRRNGRPGDGIARQRIQETALEKHAHRLRPCPFMVQQQAAAGLPWRETRNKYAHGLAQVPEPGHLPCTG